MIKLVWDHPKWEKSLHSGLTSNTWVQASFHVNEMEFFKNHSIRAILFPVAIQNGLIFRRMGLILIIGRVVELSTAVIVSHPPPFRIAVLGKCGIFYLEFLALWLRCYWNGILWNKDCIFSCLVALKFLMNFRSENGKGVVCQYTKSSNVYYFTPKLFIPDAFFNVNSLKYVWQPTYSIK